MARHQHDGMLADAVGHAVEPGDLDAAEDAVPNAAKHEGEDREVGAVEVGGDLVEVALGLAAHFLDRRLALDGNLVHGLAQRGLAEHELADDALRQQRRPPNEALLAIEKDLQRARHPADHRRRALGAVTVDEAA